MWKAGDRLAHRYNSDLGPGRVIDVSGRRLRVEFPDHQEILSFAVNADALAPLELASGSRARIEATGEIVTVEVGTEGDTVRITDGRELSLRELWPLPEEVSPIDRLARGEIGAREDFVNRLDGLRLQRLRGADGLGSFLGGRIQLFPHQLYVAERACREEGADPSREQDVPVRWLLADEVGLGKTVEACLIMNRLIHTGRAERTLVVAPESLTVQWLGELWRKHHQVFVLLDAKRLADVEKDYGQGFNPFEVYRQSILSFEALRARPQLTEQAVAAGIDLLVVDEAHHLKRPSAHPGNRTYRAIAPIAAEGKSLLLLTATPLEEDAHGFFRLLQLLRPDDLTEDSFAERLRRKSPLPPCTSATRRVDVGGLPPRVGVPIEIGSQDGNDPRAGGRWELLSRLEHLERGRERRKAGDVFRALASPAALAQLARGQDEERAVAAARARDADPRIAWLVEAAGRWHQRGEKTLIFVAFRESLDLLKTAVERSSTARVGVFHEGLSLKRRDLEVAQFRLSEGPTLLISTECGGEGRNFEFCRRLVLFDLPWNPTVVEQRIGRLDRIGRSLPTEIVYFKPPSGLGRAVARLYEAMGLFSEPLGGLERELRHVQRDIEKVALCDDGPIDPAIFEDVLVEAQQAGVRVREAAYHALHREPYRGEMAASVLARVPEDLEVLNEEVVLRAAARFGFDVEQQSGPRTWLIEHGPQALVDHLEGVPAGARFLGTFDRATAVDDESIEFFASGHPLVEGILTELEEGSRGRAALLQIPGDEEVFGLLAVYRRGASFEAVAVDGRGERRDDLAAMLTARDVVTEHVDARKWTSQPSWKRGIRKLAKALPEEENPFAVAAFRVRNRAGAGTL